jgi:type IV secretion system protein VirD4
MRPRVLIIVAVLSLAASYLANRTGAVIDASPNIKDGLKLALDNTVPAIIAHPLYIGTHPYALLFSFGAALCVWCLWAYLFAARGKRRAGIEAGSSRWGTKKEGRKYKDVTNEDNNLILSENFGIVLSRKKHDIRYERNLNCLVIGGSGAGKTRYFVKPNLCNLSSSYFVSDPKGTMIKETGAMFAGAGFRIASFNTVDFGSSSSYNPFAYVKTDADILSFVNCLIKNTNAEKDNRSAQDPFWENAERLLYTALIALLRDWFRKEDYNLPGLLTLLDIAGAREEDESYRSPLDFIFEEIETGRRVASLDVAGESTHAEETLPRAFREGADSDTQTIGYAPSNFYHNKTGACPADTGGISDDFALLNYRKFKTAAGKTLKSIIISCNVRTAPLAIADVEDLLYKDEMKLDTLGDAGQRAVVFAVMSDTDPTYMFLHAIMIWQAINLLCTRALIDFGGRLPTLVQFFLDEFGNFFVPDAEKMAAVLRSRNMSLILLLQSIAQLKAKYTEHATEAIVECCDTTVLLGGKSTKTNKEIAEEIGKETIQAIGFNQQKGANSTYTINHTQQGRELIDASEIARLKRTKAIILIAGTWPLLDNKYPLEKHPRYHLIDPGHKRERESEVFDFRAYQRKRRAEEDGLIHKTPRMC